MKMSARYLRILIKVLIGIVIAVIVGAIAFLALQIIGRGRLYNGNRQNAPQLGVSALAESLDGDSVQNQDAASGYTWQEGDIRYQGSIYRYNEEILTFLFMGIDKDSETETLEPGNEGGQSDAMFLLVLNPSSQEASIIGIPRDTMTEIEVYNSTGGYMGVATSQITLQHGYGDGAELSCERSVKAVSKLFYGLNINGYCAINMAAIPTLNDAIGGVELTVLEDILGTNMKEGQTVTLKGEAAYHYLHNRDITVFASAQKRLERQKQYLNAYGKKVLEAIKQDITLPVTLYSTLSKYMVTDVTLDEVSYLSTRVAGYHFDSENMYSLEGETVMGRKFEEFYADETALYELILKVFYEEVGTAQSEE